MTDHSNRLRTAAVSLALVCIPSAASATSGASAPARAAAATTPSGSATTASKATKPKRYCVIRAVTGSRIPLKTCKTREGWLHRGFDPLAPEQP